MESNKNRKKERLNIFESLKGRVFEGEEEQKEKL